MKLSDIINAYSALDMLSSLKMPAQGSYKIAKNMRKLEPEYKSFEEARGKIVANYFTNVDGTMTLLPDNKEAADAEFNSLMQLEVEFEPYMIKLSDFGNSEPTPAQLFAIYWMIEDEKEDPNVEKNSNIRN